MRTHPWRWCTQEIARLSKAARSGKAALEELSGSTITVTSLGAFGGIAAMAIINPPEVTIIGVNRIVDGYEAAAFIKALKDSLEAPAVLIETLAIAATKK